MRVHRGTPDARGSPLFAETYKVAGGGQIISLTPDACVDRLSAGKTRRF